jgi:outer membrane receptor for ferrienterochelin and colicins
MSYKTTLLFIVLNSTIIGNIVNAQSQNCSSKILDSSKEKYEIGDFTKLKSELESCVKNKGFATINELNKGRELLALTAIVEDQLELATVYIEQIVESNSKFVPTYRNIVFDLILDKVKRENVGVSVSSVSKKAEDLNTAPATVKLITKEEIQNRGYVDLIDLLNDLPGFDISKIMAVTYANVYQLGFRQENTERTLFMVDGVEENDLWLNWAYISRQYPMSNIKAVEILYGPSSIMYGPRAFVGAINVITYSPKEKPKDSLQKEENGDKTDQKFYLHGQTQAGNLNTQLADITLGLRGQSAALQVTGRYFRSDEHDLSQTEFYNYSTSDIDHFGYRQMNLTRKPNFSLNDYLTKFNLPANHPYYTSTVDGEGNISQINLTQAGIDRARELDKQAYSKNVNGQPIGFSNHSQDYFIGAKLVVENFMFGVRHWKQLGGFNFYQDIDVAGSRNGALWSPENTTFYAQYDREINDKISISNTSNFSIHRLGRESNRVNFIAFGDPRGLLHLAHLVNPEELIPGIASKTRTDEYGTEIHELNTSNLLKNGWRNRYYYYEAQQFRNELRFFYESSKFKWSSGVDVRSTLTQGDYLIYMDFNTDAENSKDYKKQQSNTHLARELGIVESQMEGSNMFSIFDIGFFNQITFILGNKFYLSGGNRIDYNQIRSSGGYGIGLSPRLTAIYNSPKTTIKLSYSRGLQNVSQWTKYSTGGGRVPNPDLKTESIDFLNMEYAGRALNGLINWNIMGFGYIVNDAVSSGEINGIRKHFNAGQYRNFGTLTTIEVVSPSKNWNFHVNHTFNQPELISSSIIQLEEPLRLGDISTHRVNLSISRKNYIGNLNNIINLRVNYVSERPIGPGTTQVLNPGVDGTGKIPAYLLINGNIGFKFQTLPFLRLDLMVENILNGNLLDDLKTNYYHPGPREASGTFNLPNENVGIRYGDKNVPYIPQRPRFFQIRITYTI